MNIWHDIAEERIQKNSFVGVVEIAKGGKNKYWSKEEKLRIVKKVTDKGLSSKQVSKEENVDGGTIRRWVREYLEEGEKALENKRKPGNPLVKYSRKKELTPMEKLEYENMKLRIENERLKKGYIVKGDGTIVIFKK